jgi:2-C-methyl-D-erythritol 4-phosphate cytidylyltransferase/2-C-methyl-D-erythritol 2,4-cyclodiphosphate synthase
MKNRLKTIAVIVAGGAGTRVGSKVPKQFLPYKGKTVLEHAIVPFLMSEKVDGVVVVIPEQNKKEFDAIFDRLSSYSTKPIGVTIGGESRQESVKNGLDYISNMEDAIDEWIVIIHDGARPNITIDVIDENIETAKKHKAAVTVVEATDTMRIISQKSLKSKGNCPIMRSETLPRKLVYNVQTPQTFQKKIIEKALKNADEKGIVGTDDSMLVDMLGVNPIMVKGKHDNIKITRKEDLPGETVVGNGFDVHRLVEGRKLILCGVEIPYDLGLFGHSDADVAAHALMDSILGAMGMGDIGRHFPDNDDNYKNADSMKLLASVKEMADYQRIVNVDITIVAEKPKLMNYIDDMETNIAKALDISEDSVNIKATTTEGLGFIGNKEGIAALATCTIIK